MTPHSKDIEIYIRSCPREKILAWISRVLGPLEKKHEDTDQTIYHCNHHGHIVPVVITDGIAAGPFTGVWFNSDETPWAHDVECAREIHLKTGCTVRCDPCGVYTQVDPYSDVFLQISDMKEELIDWSDALSQSEKIKDL